MIRLERLFFIGEISTFYLCFVYALTTHELKHQLAATHRPQIRSLFAVLLANLSNQDRHRDRVV